MSTSAAAEQMSEAEIEAARAEIEALKNDTSIDEEERAKLVKKKRIDLERRLRSPQTPFNSAADFSKLDKDGQPQLAFDADALNSKLVGMEIASGTEDAELAKLKQVLGASEIATRSEEQLEREKMNKKKHKIEQMRQLRPTTPQNSVEDLKGLAKTGALFNAEAISQKLERVSEADVNKVNEQLGDGEEK